MTSLSRREFLTAGGVTLIGAGLAACSKRARSSGGATLSSIIAGKQQNVSLVTASDEILSRPDGDRFPFALFVPQTTNDHYTGGSARIWAATSETAAAIGPFDASWHDDGLGDKGIYVARVPFPRDGSWLVFVEGRPTGVVRNGASQTAGGTVDGGTTVGIGRRSQQPIPGDKAISVATPTFSNHRGVNPICTRTPACSMHDVSLDAALHAGKPTVLIISTPRFCTSRTCGPVTDIVDAVKHATGSGASFVHVEVYVNDTDAPAKQILAPAAAAWKLASEPSTYFIRADGTIAERFVGAADRVEVAAQVEALRR
jgi:hypothetical protein